MKTREEIQVGDLWCSDDTGVIGLVLGFESVSGYEYVVLWDIVDNEEFDIPLDGYRAYSTYYLISRLAG